MPNGVQQVFFALGMTAFYVIVGLIGTPELAASSVLLNLYLVGVLPGLGFGLAGMSLVSQALGRRDADDARRWGWDIVKIAFVVVALISVPGMIRPEWILSGFLRDPDTLALAAPSLRLISFILAIDACGNVLMNCLLGAGDNRRVMARSIGYQWGIFLPLALVFGWLVGGGLIAVWTSHVLYRIVFVTTMFAMWRGDRWTGIRI